MLEAGIKGNLELTVTKDDTAAAIKSGGLEVFATPKMIALIEETAWKSVETVMEEGTTTVGTEVNVKHLAATPIGMKVSCETNLTKIDGRRLVFDVEVYDEVGKIGEGTHERCIIQAEKFLAKTKAKAVQQ